jgi:hypothetical protein
LRVGPCLTDSVEKLITISGTVVSPRVTSPAARNRAIRSVSRRATALRMLRLPSENGTPAAIGPLSLIRNGTPASGPSAARESAGENSRSARPFTAAFASSTLRQALAVGADVLRVDWPDADYIADLAADEHTPTLALADAVHGDQPALVRCGDRSADRSTGALPAFLARELGAAQALGLVSLPVDGSQLIAERRLPAGRREPLRIPPPPSARWRPRAPGCAGRPSRRRCDRSERGCR